MSRRGARRRAAGRDVHGVVLLDKPRGLGSNEVLQRVKRLFRARKAGHTGSLDRLASGLLPLCFGEATKLSGFLLNADKRYRAVMRLGERTATGDAEGEVVERLPVPPLDDGAVEAALARFRGPIRQVPPMHSALKHRGQRLYKLAHQGITVEREPREVTIHRLVCTHREEERIGLEIDCSKGTYIRTLAEDLGAALGTAAHLVELRRVGSGPFGEDGMVSLERLEAAEAQGQAALDECLAPMESIVGQWPAVALTRDLAWYLRRGQPVRVPRAPSSGWVRLHADDGRFVGVGEVLDDGRIGPRRLVAVGEGGGGSRSDGQSGGGQDGGDDGGEEGGGR